MMEEADRMAHLRQEKAERLFKREEEGAQARSDYEASALAVRERTARLRAQRLAKEAQKASSSKKQGGAKRIASEAKAAQMASRQLDRLSDPDASDAELASRKRKLIKGPKEFRNIRADLPPMTHKP